jgi:hypothetical protein
MNYTKPKNWPSLIRPGELKQVFDEFGNSDDFVNDLILYMQEDFARSTKERFLTKWNGVETVNEKNFQVYRGISLTRESKRYEFFDRLLGDKTESSRYPIPLVNDQIQISFGDYSSWTRSHNIAKGYADAREGDIKVVLIAESNDLKILANLFEIGDESDEVLAYPIEGLEVRFKAWRVVKQSNESIINNSMKTITSFREFIIESLSDDYLELFKLGLASLPAHEVYDEILRLGPSDPLEDYLEKSPDSNFLIFAMDWVHDLDELEHIGVDSKEYRRQADGITLDRAFGGEIYIIMNFDTLEFKVSITVSQLDMNWEQDFEYTLPMAEVFGGDHIDSENPTVEGFAEEINDAFAVFYHQEDPFRVWGIIEDSEKSAIELHKYQNQTDDENYEDEYDDEYSDLEDLDEKKKLKFHHSDAPDANGKFKELGVNKLADWLIRTRGGNMQKITGSLNQQINFNKKKNPSYAKKMESTREAVKRKLAKKK